MVKHESLRRIVWRRVLPLLVISAWATASAAQEPAGKPAAAAPDKSAAADAGAARKPRGRLPAYYAKVVSDKQRATIYEIQAKYNAQLAKLKEQVDELTVKRDSEVEKVLSEEQRKEIARMKAERRARAGGKASASAAADGG